MPPPSTTPPSTAFRVYDTLSDRVVDLSPREPGRVGVYVCGLTVDGETHLGHARSAVVFDVLVRRLRARGLAVTHVRNVTDVDDKIIDRARAEGVSPADLADRNLATYRAVLERLGVRAADREPRVTSYVDEIIEMTRQLVARGHAYEAGGGVWFSVAAYPEYGALSGQNTAMLREGTRLEPSATKRDPRDFSLWKPVKPNNPGEPSWPSPWGAGRPGWHIECSAMSRHVLGAQFDIHGGGLDLRFPHHENERAQTESATGLAPMAAIWMHHGLLTVGREKMAKSVGNVLTAGDTLARHPAEAIRAWFLSARWRSPLELSEGGIAQAAASLDRLYAAVGAIEAAASRGAAARRDEMPVASSHPRTGAAARSPRSAVVAEAEDLATAVASALDDDLNTPRALAETFTRLPGLASRAMAAAGSEAAEALRIVRRALEPLGVLQLPSERHVATTRALRSAWQGVDPAEVDRLVQLRADARKRSDYATADRLKAELVALGVEIRDGPDGTTWHVHGRPA